MNGRAGEIRTHDLLHPMQARYQATLQPEQGRVTKRYAFGSGKCFFGGFTRVRISVLCQIRHLGFCAPDELRVQLKGLNTSQLIAKTAGLRRGGS